MKWLRSALLSSTALTAMIAPASAAPSDAIARWTGCYVGLQSGYESTRSNVNAAFPGSVTRAPNFSGIGTIKANNALVGGQAGCNYQNGMLVAGAEGELWWSGKASSSIVGPDSALLISSPAGTPGFSLTMQNRWSGAFSLRAGVVFDRALVYGRLGVAATRFEYDAVGISPQQGVATGSAMREGLLLGVGTEIAVTERWSARLEYQHGDFGKRQQNFTGSISGISIAPPGLATIGVHERMDLITIGANYKL